jgi:hypothetical protein
VNRSYATPSKGRTVTLDPSGPSPVSIPIHSSKPHRVVLPVRPRKPREKAKVEVGDHQANWEQRVVQVDRLVNPCDRMR